MTRKEAIQALKMMNLTGVHSFLHWEEMMEVRDMAIAALQEHDERGNPAPLTLDELREMDGEPVWLLPDRQCFIVNNNFLPPYGERHPCGVDMWGSGTSLSLLAKCCVYRYLPKEDAK